MMDPVLERIANYAASVRYESLSEGAIAATLRHHIDGIGCAAGGFNSEACEIARGFARTAPASDGCSVFGVPERVVLAFGAFANVSHVRHLDFNDVYPGKSVGGGHPNDMALAVLASVELAGGTGKDVILGIHIAYEVFGALADVYPIRDKGWDQGAHASIAIAAAVGRILGLTNAQIAHAVSLAITMGMPLRVTRIGELSHWKGCATAHSAVNALLAAQLAKRGMTGPLEPFRGTDGFERHVNGPVELAHLGEPRDGGYVIERSLLKFLPAETSSQGPVGVMLGVRDQVPMGKLETIKVETYYEAWHEIGGGQGDREQKWDPQTRESADHSLPYMMSVALVDGNVSIDSFTPKRVADPALRPVMQKIDVIEDPQLSRRFRSKAEAGARITIRLTDGSTISKEVAHPRGHPKNRMSDDEVRVKFLAMVPKVISEAAAKSLLDTLWNLEAVDGVSDLAANFRTWRVL